MFRDDDMNEIDSLQAQVEELEAENKRLNALPGPAYYPYCMRYSRDDLLMMLAQMDKAKEREHELDEQEEKRIPVEPAYHSIIKLGHDAEIELNGEDITIVIPGPNDMKHCLEIDLQTLFQIHKYITEKENKCFSAITPRYSEWRYEIFDANRVESLLNPKLVGGRDV